MPRPRLIAAACAAAALVLASPPASAAPPRGVALSRGWEVRDEPAAPAPPQPPPPVESPPAEGAPPPATLPRPRASVASPWRPVAVPGVFDARALPALYPGTVKRYRLRFRGPATPRGSRWLLWFGSVRRTATVYLNGRLIGSNDDPYTPFQVEARGLRPRRSNELEVLVDNRKDPRLPEGWWNWGGIVRPVRLLPLARAHISDLGVMSQVRCRGAARRCRAKLLLDGTLERRGARTIEPVLEVRLRSPSGRVIEKAFKLPTQRAASRRLRLSLGVPAPRLWAPEHPNLYRAQLVLRDRGRIEQEVDDHVGLRSVTVKRGRLYLNNRPVQLRGASIHEDMPGHGAALTAADDARIVRDLKDLGANVTRAHYLLNERLLDDLDRAGIMVWNEAPIWQRDHGANLLALPAQRTAAWRTVRRTVIGGRSHPSVITHSVANELSFTPDRMYGTRRFLTVAAAEARDLDPTIPISLDIKTRPGFPEQFTYEHFDMLGLNSYFGWYDWQTVDFSLYAPYLQEMRDLYPDQALVVTEFGAEALPELASAPVSQRGGYAFQAFHVARTLDVIDRTPFLSGAIYWTLREFEIFPGWSGGAPITPETKTNTRHHKGLLTYAGQRKPAWYVVHDDYRATPLYRPR